MFDRVVANKDPAEQGLLDLKLRKELAANLEQIDALQRLLSAPDMLELLDSIRQQRQRYEQAVTAMLAVQQDGNRAQDVFEQQVVPQETQIRQALRKTLGDMQAIADQISVIDDIAYQTNMLALNAAIEAARRACATRWRNSGCPRPRIRPAPGTSCRRLRAHRGSRAAAPRLRRSGAMRPAARRPGRFPPERVQTRGRA
ncbi:methyl-accepting chemotaxis protein [Thiomonas sp. FB-6]|uniref:methyl-accepting chemotaxis protein n=1 Tax=Thiomonas sp. FB-6 TaxID=1158291 RepID=UPI00039E6676